MKQTIAPFPIFLALFSMVLLGLLSSSCWQASPPDSSQVAAAVEATLTAWPTPAPKLIEVTRIVEIVRAEAPDPIPAAATLPAPTFQGEAMGIHEQFENPRSDTGAERMMMQLINQKRQAHGLAPLAIAPELTQSALRHSRDMATQAQPQHSGSDNSSAAQRIRDAGYLAIDTSEAIGWGEDDPHALVNWFMQDPIHRNLLLSVHFTEMGIGYFIGDSSQWKHYWTIDFGQRTDHSTLVSFVNDLSSVPPAPTSTATPVAQPEEDGPLPPAPNDCSPISAHQYATIPMTGVDNTHPDFAHGDLNLEQRGYVVSTASARLIDIAGPTDSDAPQLATLFADQRMPTFMAAYQVYDWDWECRRDSNGCPKDPLTEPDVTLLGLATTPGEPIQSPRRDAELYPGGYIAVVLYADATRITLAYTRDGTVANGYAVQIENVCVDPNLLVAYRVANAAGRDHLPALQRNDTIGVAAAGEVLVAMRDRGSFLDPRSRKDWWQ